jgi:transcription termination factor Rho
VTETDLVTAGGSPEQAELPNTVIAQDSSPAPADASSGAPAADPPPAADVTTDASKGSLSSMVLPELRALANSVGV